MHRWQQTSMKGIIHSFHIHISYSRIDNFFVSRPILDHSHICRINSWVLSDHSSVNLELDPLYYDPLSRQCFLLILFCSVIPHSYYIWRNSGAFFLSTNHTPSASTLWETAKAYPRKKALFRIHKVSLCWKKTQVFAMTEHSLHSVKVYNLEHFINISMNIVFCSMLHQTNARGKVTVTTDLWSYSFMGSGLLYLWFILSNCWFILQLPSPVSL